ncbi:MAG: NADH-quinone oxidoreductase subunit K [Deltaproteobacteria bacterium]|nr:NADH-quinone oxidoreductase subunit K [Deltaproteobacteria bacterium]
MSNVWVEHFWLFAIAAAVIFTAGLYCLVASRNLIRILVGIELLTKSVTLLLVLAGAITGRMGQMQALIITLIVVEVVAITVAAGIVIGAFRSHGTVDAKALTDLKG